jgi:hypothetical protein
MRQKEVRSAAAVAFLSTRSVPMNVMAGNTFWSSDAVSGLDEEDSIPDNNSATEGYKLLR